MREVPLTFSWSGVGEVPRGWWSQARVGWDLVTLIQTKFGHKKE
ncbi:hypothetical protein ACRN9Z_02995 [Shewanella frigidimarina]